MEIRPLGTSDMEIMRAFFGRVPERDRTFFREDVLDSGTLASWVGDRTGRRLLAVDGDAVAGYLAVLPGVGWSSHVGELRLVVDPGRRREGIGRMLARQGLIDALGLGLTKVMVEVVAEQESAIAMFQALGFEAEALLKGHVRSRDGQLGDLLVLSHLVDDAWAGMMTAGIDEEIG
jgi:ribosomal protein S18 acetylase RimI-like enzyme